MPKKAEQPAKSVKPDVEGLPRKPITGKKQTRIVFIVVALALAGQALAAFAVWAKVVGFW